MDISSDELKGKVHQAERERKSETRVTSIGGCARTAGAFPRLQERRTRRARGEGQAQRRSRGRAQLPLARNPSRLRRLPSHARHQRDSPRPRGPADGRQWLYAPRYAAHRTGNYLYGFFTGPSRDVATWQRAACQALPILPMPGPATPLPLPVADPFRGETRGNAAYHAIGARCRCVASTTLQPRSGPARCANLATISLEPTFPCAFTSERPLTSFTSGARLSEIVVRLEITFYRSRDNESSAIAGEIGLSKRAR